VQPGKTAAQVGGYPVRQTSDLPAYADHGLSGWAGRKAHRRENCLAAASNRTRENRPSGIIGGLWETRLWKK